ncbi:Glycine receptor subunit alpha-3 [Halotydeus destructor]|nr:Glycine receptor subunit alpha-3 [Halotydeus destructor]
MIMSLSSVAMAAEISDPGLYKQIKDQLLPPAYDPMIPPILNGKAVEVDIKISVLNIRSIKETDLTYTLDLFFHQHWTDHRLNTSTIGSSRVVLDSTWLHKLWIPDSYFKNAIGGGITSVIFPAMYFTIYNNSRIFMATRVSVQLTCQMQFKKYPHDTQQCFIDVMSLSHTNETVHLIWKGFDLTSNLMTTQYAIPVRTTEDCSRSYAIGTYSCLRGTLFLERRVGHFIVKRYIPSFLIVIMSFVGFWIPTNAYPARVALVITSLLALITQQLQSSAEISAAYVVAINLWMIICISFVFLALIEFAFAIAWSEEHLKKLELQQSQDSEHLVRLKRKPSWAANKVAALGDHLSIFKINPENNKIDEISRRMFPLSFAFCVLAYALYVFALN